MGRRVSPDRNKFDSQNVDRPFRTEAAANRQLWDTWARLHTNSAFYKIDEFRSGGLSLTDLDLQEVGSVAGKSLLHLQCHFGLDTLSWARLGARVTGVDFSPIAIELARQLGKEFAVDATFVCGDVEALGADLLGEYDIIYTSWGVLSWLNNLHGWAELVAKHLAPGGAFHLLEFHPVLGMFDDEGKSIQYSYFKVRDPLVSQENATYAGIDHKPMPCYQWSHSLSDVIDSLLQAGLTLLHFHEFPYCLHRCYEFMIEHEPGRYVMRDHPVGIPLAFSIKATR